MTTYEKIKLWLLGVLTAVAVATAIIGLIDLNTITSTFHLINQYAAQAALTGGL